VHNIQLCAGKIVLQPWQKTESVFGQCVSLSATTATEDSSQILTIQAGVQEPSAFSLCQQFTVELRMHFPFICSRESAKVEQIVRWSTVRRDVMLSSPYCKLLCSRQ
jgi:hypothetical protein